MGLFDDIRAKGAAYRLTEEALYSEVLREMESGVRRDGLWAKALAESAMDTNKAHALYIKYRVQSLKDEAEILLKNIGASREADYQRTTKQISYSPTKASRVPRLLFNALMWLAVIAFALYKVREYNLSQQRARAKQYCAEVLASPRPVCTTSWNDDWMKVSVCEAKQSDWDNCKASGGISPSPYGRDW
jgi:soluble lytic murein transglycosylase-like protein